MRNKLSSLPVYPIAPNVNQYYVYKKNLQKDYFIWNRVLQYNVNQLKVYCVKYKYSPPPGQYFLDAPWHLFNQSTVLVDTCE